MGIFGQCGACPAAGDRLRCGARSRERQAALAGVELTDDDKHIRTTTANERRGPRKVNGHHKTVTEQILMERARATASKAAVLAPVRLSFEEPT